jgi:hypothetical protein
MIAGILVGTLVLITDVGGSGHGRPAVAAAPPGPVQVAAMQQPQQLQQPMVMSVAAPPPPMQAPSPFAPFVVPPVRTAEPVAGPAPDQTLVTFLAAEKGEKIIVDGRPVSDDETQRFACGRHKLKIGHKKARTVDFPCGAALTLE